MPGERVLSTHRGTDATWRIEPRRDLISPEHDVFATRCERSKH